MAMILLVEDDDNARRMMALSLEAKGHEVVTCPGSVDAFSQLDERQFDVVLTDLRMEGKDAGIDVVKACQSVHPKIPVLLITAYASTDTAVAAMRGGAFDYLTKPVSADQLAMAVENALASREIKGRNSELIAGEDPVYGLIGSSMVMKRVRERLRKAAAKDVTVLISGESGTGKELAARFIHVFSPRASSPFVPVNCAAIPSELFESELFGHKRGSFTGAESDRPGLIESTNGGTLFLDEIGEMPLFIQAKLLRVLQDHRVRRVGDEMDRHVDMRVVAATNRDLDLDVRAGRFREDLFYRLNVVPIHMPPLRQHREDLPELVDTLLSRQCNPDSKPTVSSEFLERLKDMAFMGNVRELDNLLQRLLAMSDHDRLDASLLGELRRDDYLFVEISLDVLDRRGMSLDDWLNWAELNLIQQAMEKANDNITRAAGLLGTSFRSMRYRLQKFDMSNTDD